MLIRKDTLLSKIASAQVTSSPAVIERLAALDDVDLQREDMEQQTAVCRCTRPSRE